MGAAFDRVILMAGHKAGKQAQVFPIRQRASAYTISTIVATGDLPSINV